jgi:beta-barrel assembly-enhancing protease
MNLMQASVVQAVLEVLEKNKVKKLIRTKFYWLSALICTLVLSSCVETQPLTRKENSTSIPLAGNVPTALRNSATTQETLKSVAVLQDRLARVSSPLLLKNYGACKKLSRPLMGFTARNKFSYSPELADDAASALDLSDALQVVGVMPGSGAAKSGLQPGDILVSVDDHLMPQGPTAENDAPAILAPLIADESSIKLSVLRGEKKRTFTVQLTKACAFRVELGNTDIVNSFADGSRIMVTRGMIKFVESDEELAYVIAREMAHNALWHPDKLKSAAAARNIINALKPVYPQPDSEHLTSKLKPVPKEMDALADRLALYMLKRSGYDIAGVIAFWQRLAKQFPQNISYSHTALHPATDYRIAAIEKTIAEIEAQESVAKKPPVRRKKRRR